MSIEKIAVITGGTSGIGLATAKRFSSDGYYVIITGRNAEKGKHACEEIIGIGGKADFFRCDMSKSDEITSVFGKIASDFSEIDVLFNNAGIMLESKEIERLPLEEWQQTFNINTTGVFLATAILKPSIIAAHGCIINNGSIAGLQSYIAGRSYAYSASKAAVIQFTRQMAKNYAEEHVRVNCICPGIIDTDILGNRDRNEYAKRIPLGYVGKAEQVASVVKFLASEGANYITGAIIPIDGGASI